jgi:hypothetical protein
LDTPQYCCIAIPSVDATNGALILLWIEEKQSCSGVVGRYDLTRNESSDVLGSRRIWYGRPAVLLVLLQPSTILILC